MDYTPVAFSSNRQGRLTTPAHELALAVVFESGWIHFCDSPESYRAQPPRVLEFLRRAPSAWDDTCCIGGRPGEWVAVARRSGERWFVAGIQAADQPRRVEFTAYFLPPDRNFGGPWDWLLATASSRHTPPAHRVQSSLRYLSPRCLSPILALMIHWLESTLILPVPFQRPSPTLVRTARGRRPFCPWNPIFDTFAAAVLGCCHGDWRRPVPPTPRCGG